MEYFIYYLRIFNWWYIINKRICYTYVLYFDNEYCLIYIIETNFILNIISCYKKDVREIKVEDYSIVKNKILFNGNIFSYNSIYYDGINIQLNYKSNRYKNTFNGQIDGKEVHGSYFYNKEIFNKTPISYFNIIAKEIKKTDALLYFKVDKNLHKQKIYYKFNYNNYKFIEKNYLKLIDEKNKITFKSYKYTYILTTYYIFLNSCFNDNIKIGIISFDLEIKNNKNENIFNFINEKAIVLKWNI